MEVISFSNPTTEESSDRETPLYLQMDPTGNQVVLGYADGVVRLFALETENDTKSTGSSMYKLTKALSARYLFTFQHFPGFFEIFVYLSSLGEYF